MLTESGLGCGRETDRRSLEEKKTVSHTEFNGQHPSLSDRARSSNIQCAAEVAVTKSELSTEAKLRARLTHRVSSLVHPKAHSKSGDSRWSKNTKIWIFQKQKTMSQVERERRKAEKSVAETASHAARLRGGVTPTFHFLPTAQRQTCSDSDGRVVNAPLTQTSVKLRACKLNSLEH